MSKDLEGFVEDRSQLGKDRAAANPAAFVVLDLWLRDAHPIHFPIDVLPTQRQRFRRRSKPTVATQAQNHFPNWVAFFISFVCNPGLSNHWFLSRR